MPVSNPGAEGRDHTPEYPPQAVPDSDPPAVDHAPTRNPSLLHNAFECLADPSMVVGPDFRIVLANAAARIMAGGIDPAAEGLTCYQVSHHCQAPASIGQT